MVHVTQKLIILKSVCFAIIFADSSIYQSIYWNPWNPLFACEDPSINVRIGDTINFLCPSDEYNFYIPSSHVNMIYENLYFLNDNKDRFESCNATGTRRLLKCDDKQATAKLYTISFRDIQTSADSMEFKRGGTYYLIGTGFRKLHKLNNVVNGSCRENGSKGQFRLRLKINVCEEDDKCNICESAGCYYEKCGASCSQWASFGLSMSKGKCNKIESRNCVYPYLENIKKVEYKATPSPNISQCERKASKVPLIQEKIRRCDVNKYKIALYVIIPVTVLVFVIYLLMRSENVTKKVSKVCTLLGNKEKEKVKDGCEGNKEQQEIMIQETSAHTHEDIEANIDEVDRPISDTGIGNQNVGYRHSTVNVLKKHSMVNEQHT